MVVTVTGGLGHTPASLVYSGQGIALKIAETLAEQIDQAFAGTAATYYDPSTPITGIAPGGYLVVPTSVAGNKIDGRGFKAIVDANNGVASTIVGGDYAGESLYDQQIVLAGNGGLTFTAHSGSEVVVAGGGNNHISFQNSTGIDFAVTGGGNDTIIGGNGYNEISAGMGDNRIILGTGISLVEVNGNDTISAAGTDTIDVLKGSAFVYGSSDASTRLTFIGGRHASTVRGGLGSDTIHGGQGGGVFVGGSSGDNSIVGGSGAVTVTGGGNGDTLLGGAANDVIRAGLGNETLGGGGGDNVFVLKVGEDSSTAGAGYTLYIKDFNSNDLLALGGRTEDAYALNTFSVSGGNGSFLLEDGTKVVLHGFTSLSSSNFRG